MSTLFHILQKPISASVENVEKYVLACLALHNYLRLTDNALYTPAGFIDSEDKHGNFLPGEWRSHNENAFQCGSFKCISAARGSQTLVDTLEVRNRLKNYPYSNVGSVPWQIDHVRRAFHYVVR